MLSLDDWNSSGASSYASYLLTAALFLLLVYSQRESNPDLPRLNPKKITELTWSARLFDYAKRSQELFAQGTQQFPDRPYKLFTDLGDVALTDITLEDGYVIKKGTLVAMDGRTVLLNENYYPDPLRWDPYRYIRMREAGEENKSHFVSSSDKHIGFGHGIHSCPGRFFAAHELKIAFSHILLKYDWKLPEDVKDLPNMTAGSHYMMPPSTRFLVTRRQEELDLDALEC